MKPIYDMVVMGDINLDWVARGVLSFPFSELTENGRIEWTAIDELPGGSGLNFACFAQESSYRPLLLGKVGADAGGRAIYEWLQKRGLEAGVIVDDSLSTGKAFIARDARDIRFLVNNIPNANLALSTSDIELHAEAISSCGMLYVSGYCLMYPEAPRKEATLKAMRLARSGDQTRVIFDVVPHQIYRIYPSFSQFRELTCDVDILISEVSTMRRFLEMGDRSEQVSRSMAEQAAERLSEFYNRFILRYGPSGCDEQVIWDGQSKDLIWQETGHSKATDKRAYGDRLALAALKEVFKMAPNQI
jgi:sugar/nucleoside kinase (ribokinase family)